MPCIVRGPAGDGDEPTAYPPCAPVRLPGVGQDQGPQSDGKIRTTAEITLLGRAIGTTEAVFTPTGGSGTTLTFEGPIVFKSRFGPSTLTAFVVGSVDSATGKFTATSTSITGTKKFRNASGQLVFSGTQNFSTGRFTETVKGRLCTDLTKG